VKQLEQPIERRCDENLGNIIANEENLEIEKDHLKF